MGLGNKTLMRMREKLVYLMDVFVGNTCVLLDRDPNAAERRENYGRAGECRFPKHGVEYRTTSNFWLRDPSLMIFTFGLAQIAMSVFADSALGDGRVWASLADFVNTENIRKAIDTNDFGLALRNLNNLAPFLRENLLKNQFVLDGDRIGPFVNLAININRQGIDKYFPIDQLPTQWRKMNHLDLLTRI